MKVIVLSLMLTGCSTVYLDEKRQAVEKYGVDKIRFPIIEIQYQYGYEKDDGKLTINKIPIGD